MGKNIGYIKAWILIVSFSTAFPGLTIAENRIPAGSNIALGKSYTLDPKPNYVYCTDPGDARQLTDGLYSSSSPGSQYIHGPLWMQLSTVGWIKTPLVQITIDLGFVQPISGVSFNTAAGKAGVDWPTAIHMLASDDGNHFFNVGDLIGISLPKGQPPSAGYFVHRYSTDKLTTHGRYVKLLVLADKQYIISDEIEVYRGDNTFLANQLPGIPITDVDEFYRQSLVRRGIIKRITSDAQVIQTALSSAQLSANDHRRIEDELTAIAAEVDQLPDADLISFRAVLPLNVLHARLFHLQAALWRARNCAPLTAWQSPLWDPLSPSGVPPLSPPPVRIQVAMMSGEYRAGAFNLSNATDHDMTVRLRFEKLPALLDPPWMTVHEVAWTDTKIGIPVASALPEVKRKGEDFLIRIPAGVTRQVWLTFHPTDIKPGVYEGRIAVRSDGMPNIDVQLQLRVSPLNFRAQPTLHLGGWDYTDSDRRYGVTPENRGALIAHLREHFVDTPWATSGIMPAVPDFTQFDTWLQRWPGAQHYYVFLNVGDLFSGAKRGTLEFNEKVGAWISAYVAHLRERGLKARQLGVLLVDEPMTPKQDEMIVEWAKAIRSAEPEVLIWENPQHKDPATAETMLAICDIICPHRPMFLAGGSAYRAVYARQRAAGKSLNFYSALGPTSTLDPYSYHRLQAWTSWQQGATAEFFWAFGDSGGGSSWNEYAASGSNYTPLFLDNRTVTPAKHMEAIREGVEDYEYFVMLRDRIRQLERAGRSSSKIAAAKILLATAADRVLNAPSAEKLSWAEPKDRTVADDVRLEMLDALEALGPLED